MAESKTKEDTTESESGADEESASEGRFDFDFEEIKETINEVIKTLQGRFETEGARERFEDGKYDGPVVLASEMEVVEEALELIRTERQHQIAKEQGWEDEETINKIGVELNIDNDYVRTVREFDNILAEVRQPIVNEMERRSSGAEKNPMVQDDDPVMTYIFEKDAGAYGDATILCGAKAVVYNLCDEYGYTNDERELIRKAHKVAADKNGVERHTLVEDVLIIPQFKHEDIDI